MVRSTGKSGKSGLRLVHPSMDYGEAIMAYRQEFLDNDPEENMGGTGSLRDCVSAEEWIKDVDAMRNRSTCPASLVDSDIFLAVREADNKIVGGDRVSPSYQSSGFKPVGRAYWVLRKAHGEKKRVRKGNAAAGTFSV